MRLVAESKNEDVTRVVTKVRGRQGRPWSVEYRMHRREDRWLVYDIFVEGVSLVGNYRAQFNTLVRTSSYAELLRRMRARVTELTTASRASAGASVHRDRSHAELPFATHSTAFQTTLARELGERVEESSQSDASGG